MTRFLCVSILWFLVGCATLPPGQVTTADVQCIRKFKPTFKSDWYNASIDVIGKHLSGLVLFKVMPDSSHRVVFTNEAGIKFFDFGFQPDGKKITHQVIEQLDREMVVRTLQKDFELTLMNQVGMLVPRIYSQGEELFFSFPGKKETDAIISNRDCSKLLRIENGWKGKTKSVVQLFGEMEHAPDSILIEHYNFNMKIKLKRLIKE